MTGKLFFIANLLLVLFGVATSTVGQDCAKRAKPESRIPIESKFDPKEYDGWQKVVLPRFSLYLPPSFRRKDRKCDAECYDFVADGLMTLRIDASTAAGHPSFEMKLPTFCEEFYWIDNMFAWVWHVEGKETFKYEDGVLFSSNDDRNFMVGMYLLSSTDNRREMARKIFKSVSFVKTQNNKK